MPQPELMLLADAARQLGTSPDAVRQRIKRGTLRGVKGNDGRMRVYLDTGQMRPDATDHQPTTNRPNVQLDDRPDDRTPTDQTELVVELRRQVERLEAELRRQDELHRAERADLLAQLQADHARLIDALERANNRPSFVDRLAALLPWSVRRS